MNVQLSTEQDTINTIAVVARGLGADARLVKKAADRMEERPGVTVADAVDRVLATLDGSTRDRYRRALRKLIARCGDRDIADVGILELRAWTQEVMDDARTDPRHRHGRGAAGAFVDACRCLFRHALDARWRTDNPAASLRAPRRPQSGRRALSAGELTDLFDVARYTGDDPDLDTLILWYLRETACRREGLLNLTEQRINPSIPSVRVTEKGRHIRELPISPALAAALLDHRRSRNPASPHIFHYRNGRRLTDRRLDTLFRRARTEFPWAAELGVSAHWLRHTTLTELERIAGKSVTLAYAGHTTRDATDTYTKADFADLQYFAVAFIVMSPALARRLERRRQTALPVHIASQDQSRSSPHACDRP